VARRRIEEHLVLDVYADGGHYERAPSYHTLCLAALQDAAIVGEQQLGWRLVDEPKFAAMHDWLVAMSTGDGWVPPFNDSHIVWTGEHLVTGHYLLDRADYKHLVREWVPDERVRSVLAWLPPRPERGDPYAEFLRAPSTPPPPGGSVWLSGSRFALLRTGDEAQSLQLSVNCGPLVEHELESHSHLAALDFVLIGDGAPLLWEAGGPSTYDEAGYYTWYRATAAHNCVLVPGRDLADEHDSTIEHFLALPELDVLSGWHYGWGDRHRRTLMLVHAAGADPYLVVDDEVMGLDGLAEMLHSPQPWRNEPGRYVTGRHSGLLVLDSSADRIAAVRTSEGMASYPQRPGQVSQGPLYGLAREVRGSRARTIVIPFRGSPPDASVAERENLTVRLGGITDLIGGSSWLRTHGDVLLAGAAWGGTVLMAAGRCVAGGPGIAALGVSWRGAEVSATIEASARAELRLYAPGAKRVSVEGIQLPVVAEGDDVLVSLPSAGRWLVEVEQDLS
jgi:hypothetical protein